MVAEWAPDSSTARRRGGVHALHAELADGELLDTLRVHVVADETVTHLGGAYGQGKPHVALASDDYLYVSSYPIAVLEWTDCRS